MKSFVCLLFLLSFIDLSLCEDPVNIPAEPGQNINLPCRADRNSIVIAVTLTRDHLNPRYVLLYRDDKIDEDLQNPQYKNRTKLQTIFSTDGKVNLTLNSVTQKDSGVYECNVKTEIKSNKRRKRALESTFFRLNVAATQSDPPGRGHIGLVAAVVAVLAALTLFVWKKMSPSQNETQVSSGMTKCDSASPCLHQYNSARML